MTAVLAAVLLAAGCTDACKDGESICEHGHIMSCTLPDDGFLVETRYFGEDDGACAPDTCVDSTRGGQRVAACSTSGRPDPRCACAGALPFCFDATTKLTCRVGYSQELDCGAACIADATSAFCSTETAPSPACGPDGASRCDDASVITCFHGYVVERIACAHACVTSAAGVPFCTDGTSCSGSDGVTCSSDWTSMSGCISGNGVVMTCTTAGSCENTSVLQPDLTTEARCRPRY